MLAFTQKTLGHTQHLTRIPSDPFSQFMCRIHQFACRYDLRDHAACECFSCAYRIAGKSHLAGFRHANHARQKPSTTISRNDAELYEALRKLGILGRDAHIAHHRKITPGPDSRAIDRRDCRHFQIVEGKRNTLDAGPVVIADVHRRAGGRSRFVTHGEDIATRAERLARTRQDHSLNVHVGIYTLTSVGKVIRLVVAAQRISLFWIVHDQRDHGTGLFINQKFAHLLPRHLYLVSL